MTREFFRIGSGAGFSGDRYDAAELLAQHGELDALAFECLAERTIAVAQQRRREGGPGYDPRLERRMIGTLPHLLSRGAIAITNAGAADPVAGATAVLKMCSDLGHRVSVAAVVGDDVSEQIRGADLTVLESGRPLNDYADRIVSANAYIGAEGIIDALGNGAKVVVTGRVADAALFMGPIAHHFGWSLDELDKIAEATLVGHLLECAGQLTGGYFADGSRRMVPGLATLGFPYADVDATGRAVVSKVPGTGGIITRDTVVEQLLYEIDEPRGYLTPDVTVDFRSVAIVDHGDDKVSVSGALPGPRPETLKVSVGIRDGYLATGEISYAGDDCQARADIAARVLAERWSSVLGQPAQNLRLDFIGVNSTRPWTTPRSAPSEIRVRAAVRTIDLTEARSLAHEVEALYTNGPAGGGGVVTNVRETTGIVSTLIPRTWTTPKAVLVA